MQPFMVSPVHDGTKADSQQQGPADPPKIRVVVRKRPINKKVGPAAFILRLLYMPTSDAAEISFLSSDHLTSAIKMLQRDGDSVARCRAGVGKGG